MAMQRKSSRIQKNVFEALMRQQMAAVRGHFFARPMLCICAC